MTTTPTRPAVPARRRPALDRRTAMRLAATEYARVTDLLRSLEPREWERPTECPGWDVRAMAGHVLGMAEMAASPLEQTRQQRAAKAAGGVFIDALTAHQVAARADLTAAALVDRLSRVGPRAVLGRRLAPWPLRRFGTIEHAVDGRPETWALGFLLDVILTRDPWMHRVDISRATGRDLHLTADHDGVLVADVVAEWAGRHGRPVELRLSGPAGGAWSLAGGAAAGGAVLEVDAVEFCRVLSERARGEGLLAVPVPF